MIYIIIKASIKITLEFSRACCIKNLIKLKFYSHAVLRRRLIAKAAGDFSV